MLLALLSVAASVHAEPINWRGSLDAAKREANESGKLVLLHFYTPSCGPCKKLDRDVFSQPQIASAMQRDYVPVKLNADNAPAMAHAYQINRVPTEVVITPQGNVVQKLSCPLEPNAYAAQLANVSQHYRQQLASRSGGAQSHINSAYAGLRIGQHNKPQSTAPAPAPASAMAAAPNVTQNPYFAPTPKPAPTPVAQQAAAPVVPAKPIAQPQLQPPRQSQPQVVSNTPAPPANAMPSANNVGDRYAAATTPALPTPKVTAPKIAKTPALDITPTPMTPPGATATANQSKPTPAVISQKSPVLVASVGKPAPAEATETEVEPEPKTVTTPPAVAAPQVAKAAPVESPVTPQQKIEPTPDQTLASATPDANTPNAEEVWPPKLPTGTPPLAFDGYCPISLQQAQKWVRGNKTFGAIHRGRTYLFVNDTARQQFLASPDAFSPVFSGNDPVLMLDENKVVAGDRKFGFEYRGAFYLFSSKDTMEAFARKPDSYSTSVRQAMNRMDGGAGGTLRR